MSRGQMHSVTNYILHGLFLFFYGFVKYLPFPLCDKLRFLVLKVFAPRIRTSYICEAITFWFPWRVHIGRQSTLNFGVMIDGTGGVFIGHGVRIAPYVIISTADHDFTDTEKLIADQGFVVAPIHIEDDVWIGAGAKILKGVTIGKGSVIGAGSVVTKDIPPYSIAVGVPCRVTGHRRQI